MIFYLVVIGFIPNLILAALAVEFTLSFGIGGKNFASETLSDLKKKMDSNK